jgi:hypothetical protein
MTEEGTVRKRTEVYSVNYYSMNEPNIEPSMRNVMLPEISAVALSETHDQVPCYLVKQVKRFTNHL